MSRTIAALAVAAAAAGVLLGGCGSSGPSAAQVQATHATQACKALASATGVFNTLGGVNGLSGNVQQFAANVTALMDPPAGYFSPRFAADLAPVVSASGDTPAAVGKLSADCATAGVHGAIWPASMITTPIQG